MKVYRIEDVETGEGPFRGKWEKTIPQSWWETHKPPHADDSIDYQVFTDWKERWDLPKWGLLPDEYRFAFDDIGLLIDCFPGFEEIGGLVLKEYTIETLVPESFCRLRDGQVIFSVVLDSEIIKI